MIYITGDTHGHIDYYKKMHTIRDIVTKNDYVIITGDFGLIFDYNNFIYGIEEFKQKNGLFKFYKNFPCKILFIDGNHENFEILNKFETSKMFGGNVSLIDENIIWLKRGEVYNIDNKKILTIGGALSIDKEVRKIREYTFGIKTHWDEELLSKEDENKILDLIEHDKEFDYVITHAPPYKIIEYIYSNYSKRDPVSVFLDHIDSEITYKKWFFGHLHIDETYFDKYVAVFNNIHKI